jgi:hypothetical protein
LHINNSLSSISSILGIIFNPERVSDLICLLATKGGSSKELVASASIVLNDEEDSDTFI